MNAANQLGEWSQLLKGRWCQGPFDQNLLLNLIVSLCCGLCLQGSTETSLGSTMWWHGWSLFSLLWMRLIGMLSTIRIGWSGNRRRCRAGWRSDSSVVVK